MSKRKSNSPKPDSSPAKETPADDAPADDAPTQERSVEEALAESDADGAIAVLEKNQSRILYLAIAVVVLLCAFLVWRQVSQANHVSESQAYSSAVASGNVDELDKVIAGHSGSLAGGNALLSKADILQKNEGKEADAKAALEKFTAEYKSHPRYPQGLFALGNLLQKSGDIEGAQSYYEQVIKVQTDGDLTPLARLRLGDLALAAGDIELAEQNYKESMQRHPGNPFADTAMSKIELLKIGSPPVVPKPEPPKEEAPKIDDAAEKGAPKAGAKSDAKSAPAPKGKGGNKGKAPAPKAENAKGGAKKGNQPKAKSKAPKADNPKAPAPKANPKAETGK